MRKTIIAIVAIIILILAGRMIVMGNRFDEIAVTEENIFANLSSKPKRGSPAPDFVLKDLHGAEIQLSAFRGKPVLINFWSVDCPPCLKEMPVLQSASEKGKDTLIVIGINMGDPINRVTSFVQSNRISFTILTDSDGRITETYRVAAYPVSYFIDSNGIIRDYHTGQLSTELLSTYLGKLGINLW